jgi:hypothetical protein
MSGVALLIEAAAHFPLDTPETPATMRRVIIPPSACPCEPRDIRAGTSPLPLYDHHRPLSRMPVPRLPLWEGQTEKE